MINKDITCYLKKCLAVVDQVPVETHLVKSSFASNAKNKQNISKSFINRIPYGQWL